MFHLTATPVNNALTDFQHLIELFSREKPDAFATRVGIHNLTAHFRQLEKQLASIVSGQVLGELFAANSVEAGQVLFSDKLFRELVVQRSRAYVVASQKQQGASAALFPTKEDSARRRLFSQKNLRPSARQGRNRVRQGKTAVRAGPVSSLGLSRRRGGRKRQF